MVTVVRVVALAALPLALLGCQIHEWRTKSGCVEYFSIFRLFPFAELKVFSLLLVCCFHYYR